MFPQCLYRFKKFAFTISWYRIDQFQSADMVQVFIDVNFTGYIHFLNETRKILSQFSFYPVYFQQVC